MFYVATQFHKVASVQTLGVCVAAEYPSWSARSCADCLCCLEVCMHVSVFAGDKSLLFPRARHPGVFGLHGSVNDENAVM